MKLNVVGVDIAKRVFQLHWVEEDTGEIVSVQLKREKSQARSLGTGS
jgi:transposase